jgi:putative endopeptidase
MIRYIREAFHDSIKGAAWMEEATQVKALEKLAKFNVKVGYVHNY